MKRMLGFFILPLLLMSCSTLHETAGRQISLTKELARKSGSRYSAWLSRNNNDYSIMYYSDTGNYEQLAELSHALSSGRTQLIYYINKSEYHNLGSIIILGYYAGNPEKKFTFTIEDMKGEVLYQSAEHKFKEFPHINEPRRFVEYPVGIKNIPREIIIKFTTNSTREDGLFVIYIPNKTNVFSYQYLNDNDYSEYKQSNWAIFPKFVK